MEATNRLMMDVLKENYEYLSEEQLKDLILAGTTEHQLEKANVSARREIDKRLSSYVLDQDLPSYVHTVSPSCGPRLRVAVIGMNGSGKSATGNTLLQEHLFKESSRSSCQTVVRQEEQSRFDPLLTVVDMPGSWKVPKIKTDEGRIDLYVFVINLAVPHLSEGDLEEIYRLKDYNRIVNSKRCILLLTHAKDALHGRSLHDFLQEVRHDPLHDFVMNDMEAWRTMAINNNTRILSTYEANKQYDMIMAIIRRTFANATFQRQSGQKRCHLVLLIGLCLLFVAAIVIMAVLRNMDYHGSGSIGSVNKDTDVTTIRPNNTTL